MILDPRPDGRGYNMAPAARAHKGRGGFRFTGLCIWGESGFFVGKFHIVVRKLAKCCELGFNVRYVKKRGNRLWRMVF